MFIYQLCMSYEGYDGDCAFDFDYMAHDNKFTKEEFEVMCKESFDNCRGEQSNYFIKKFLKERYGFKDLPIETSFDFEESFNE